jgi:hypothetical protein
MGHIVQGNLLRLLTSSASLTSIDFTHDKDDYDWP